jgi:hypothetical protein
MAAGCFVVLTAQTGIAATPVTITDRNIADVNCGVLDSLDIEPGTSVKLTVTGDCLGERVPPGAANRSISVVGGQSVATDLSRGAVLVLPISHVEIVTQPSRGAVSVVGTVATYSTSATTTAMNDSFSYRLFDANGTPSNAATITVLAIAPEMEKCVTTDTVICQTANHPKVENGGIIMNLFMESTQIHVWEFVYTPHGSVVDGFDYNTTGLSDFWATINQVPGSMLSEEPSCQKQAAHIYLSHPLPGKKCILVEGQTYYLNIQTESRDSSDYYLWRDFY